MGRTEHPLSALTFGSTWTLDRVSKYVILMSVRSVLVVLWNTDF
jgi:hypothetical protein